MSAIRQRWRAARKRPAAGRAHITMDPEMVQARAAVLIVGLPETAAAAAENRGVVDWRPLAAALDTLYVARGGALGVRMFLNSPQRSLHGDVPADLVARGNGELERVARAAYDESARADLSRVG